MFPLSILINFSAVDKECFCHLPEWTLVPGGGPPHWERQHLEESLGSAMPHPLVQWDQCFKGSASRSKGCCKYPPLDLSNRAPTGLLLKDESSPMLILTLGFELAKYWHYWKGTATQMVAAHQFYPSWLLGCGAAYSLPQPTWQSLRVL